MNLMNENRHTNLQPDPFRIAFLIAGFIRQSLTEAEHDELDVWVNDSDHNMLLFEDLTNEDNLEANLAWMDNIQAKQSLDQLLAKTKLVRSPRKKQPVYWVAAACLLGLLGFMINYYYHSGSKNKPGESSQASTRLAGSNKHTTLTIGDQSINLSDVKTGGLALMPGTLITKTADGALVYGNNNVNTGTLHTLATPVGEQFKLRLPDGTIAWLNAASSIRFPPSFSGVDRTVSVTGEIYFEVAKNKALPFRVALPDSSLVTVTGTHFNVQAYAAEATATVALLEGAVHITTAGGEASLQPGMMGTIDNRQVRKTAIANEEAITGWKEGLFVFHDSRIEDIMQQLEHWYGKPVVYLSKTRQLFNGTIARTEPLEKILNLLELNGYVHFTLKNNSIYVLP
ncbi:MAG: hypothetical protein JWQ27_261 [Ferruginibacter sp.]|nr:hypothetical protein [Ferruginibacter sp.]